MRPLFITGSLVHGGAERHAITLANRLAERGHECHAVYIQDDASQRERLTLRGPCTVRCLEATRYFDASALARFARHIATLRPTVLVAANAYALMYGALAARAAGLRVPTAVVWHSTKLLSLKEQLQMLAYRPFFWSADCAVFVCERQREYWRRRGVFGRSNEVIYNGVDVEHFQSTCSAEDRRALRAALGFAEGDLVVAMSAVLRPEKNPLQLVEALAMLRGMQVRARGLFIGDGEMRPAIEARARALGLESDIVITGLQQDVRPFLSACDTLVLCSLTEAFSLAAIEAMALARPVVHSDVGGAAEMIRSGRNGFLFPVGDTRALAEKLALCAERELRERLGLRAREIVEAHFSERAMVDRYEQALSELGGVGSGVAEPVGV